MKDKRSIYNKEIAELVTKIKKTANENGIPFFFAAAVKDGSDGRYYIESDCLLPEMFGYDINPNDTRFADFSNILSKEFTTRPITGNDAISVEDLAINDDFAGLDLGEE